MFYCVILKRKKTFCQISWPIPPASFVESMQDILRKPADKQTKQPTDWGLNKTSLAEVKIRKVHYCLNASKLNLRSTLTYNGWMSQ